MQEVLKKTAMQDVLNSLGLSEINFGTSTSVDFFGDTSQNLIE